MATTSVREHLSQQGVEVEELPHPPTHTATGEAAALGLPAHEVAKTIVLDTDGGHALAVIRASDRLDMGLVHRATGDSRAQLASEEELERDYPQYELGAFPPLGSLLDAPLYVDPQVLRADAIVFAAGTADSSLRVRTQDLLRSEQPTIVPLAKELDEKELEFYE